MKKIVTMITVCAIAVAANAQQPNAPRTVGAPIGSLQSPPLSPQSVTDTLGGYSWTQSTTVPTFYGSQDGNGVYNGYLSGTNGWGDLSKGQQFSPGQPVVVSGGIYWFIVKSYASNNANSKITAKAFDMTGTTGTTSTITGTAACPGNMLASLDITMANLDTSSSFTGAQVAMFPTAFYTANDFLLSFDMSNQDVANGDSCAVITSTDGDAGGSEMSWEQWDDNNWYTIQYAWSGLDIDMAIFALVDMTTGTNQTPELNGATLGFSGPNPVAANTTINYSFAKDVNNAKLIIIDANGKLIQEEALGSKAAGSYSYDLNASNLAAGTYFVMLQGGDAHLAVKMVKE